MERKSIPKTVRIQVWNQNIGEEQGIGKCNVCSTEIKVSNFDCGHIVAAIEGGPDILKNLVPICRLCNLSMGKENLNEFKNKYFSDKSYVDMSIHLFYRLIVFTAIIKNGSIIIIFVIMKNQVWTSGFHMIQINWN
jgi:hypothetical protein